MMGLFVVLLLARRYEEVGSKRIFRSQANGSGRHVRRELILETQLIRPVFEICPSILRASNVLRGTSSGMRRAIRGHLYFCGVRIMSVSYH